MVGRQKLEISSDFDQKSTLISANCLFGNDFFVDAPKLKDSLTDPPIFRGFVIMTVREIVKRWSADSRSTFFAEFYIMISAEGRPIIGRQSTDDRQTVGRWYFIKEQLPNRRRISTVIRPMIARLSADRKHWFVVYWSQCMYPHNLWS